MRPRPIPADDFDVDAFWRREHPAVYRVCFGLLVDAAAAEDLAQDAMVHLIDRLDEYDAARPFSTWRNTVVANLCRDRMRRVAARRRHEEIAARESPERPLPAPDDALASSEVSTILRESLSALTPREREVFVLHDLEETPTAEVALALSITEGTTRSLLFLARRRLRRLLAARLAMVEPGDEGGRDDAA